MASRSRFGFRLKILGAFCALGAAALVARMTKLTVVDGPGLRKEVGSITCRDAVDISYRGQIVDRNGAALATSVESFQVAVRREEYKYDAARVAPLADALGINARDLDKKLRTDTAKFFWLSRGVDTDAANKIRGLRILGIDVYRDQQRTYPHGSLAAHVVGFSGVDEKGLEGLEKRFDEEIRGEPIKRKVCKDGRGRVWLDRGGLAGMNQGATVELTIDATLQSVAEAELLRQVEEMDADGGSVVILDPRTGEVLAMANAPAFDPNRYSSYQPAARRNRAVTDTFEPGSTMKPFVVAAAIDAGVVRPTDRFDCENGKMKIGGWTIHDHHPHKVLSVPEIIEVSSNICSAKIGAVLGADRLYDYLKSFGFARPTDVDLPGEVGGRLSAPSQWKPINLANISFGQGVTATTMQMASAFGTLANGGTRMLPYVVSKITDLDGDVLHYRVPEAEGKVLKPEIARAISGMLELVIGPNGTAETASIAGVRVAGKTGTAQKVVDGRYSKSNWVSSFVGYLPAEDPRLVIAVNIDEPREHHYGGVVAAPVFKRIAEASLDYLHVHRPHVLQEEKKAEEKKTKDRPFDEPLTPAGVPTSPPPAVTAFGGTMPELRGLSLRSAMRALDGCGCEVEVDGSGYVVEQRPEPGVEVSAADEVRVVLARAGEK
jgi:cell division protein FtsI (penicillin-binding protein 3)